MILPETKCTCIKRQRLEPGAVVRWLCLECALDDAARHVLVRAGMRVLGKP